MTNFSVLSRIKLTLLILVMATGFLYGQSKKEQLITEFIELNGIDKPQNFDLNFILRIYKSKRPDIPDLVWAELEGKMTKNALEALGTLRK